MWKQAASRRFPVNLEITRAVQQSPTLLRAATLPVQIALSGDDVGREGGREGRRANG